MTKRPPRETRAGFESLAEETRSLRRRLGLPEAGARLFVLKLDTTNLCNLQCMHCGVHLIRDVVHPVSMTAELLDTVAGDVFPHCHEVCFGSMAEPLMSPRLDDALRLARDAGVPVLQIVTNALLLDEKTAGKWIDLRLDVLSVSADAACAETYARIRRADFHTMVENVAGLRDLKIRRGRAKPLIRFNFVVMRSNLREMPDMVDLAHDLGAEIIEFSMPFLDRRLDLEAELPTGDPSLWEEMIEKTRQRVDARGLSRVHLPGICAATARARGRPEVRAVLPPNADGSPLCLAPWSYLCVGPNGDVHPCCSPYVLGGPPFGNLRERTIADILTGPSYRALRQSLISGRLRDDCARCKATDFLGLCQLNQGYYLDVGPRLPRAGS
jgi:radical SAM protein with 4Fe4S-binding SPASM domain